LLIISAGHVVETDEVYTKLRKIKLYKSVSPEGTSHKILKKWHII